MAKSFPHEDRLFQALADPSRRKLLDQLHASDGQTLGQMCEHLKMTRQGVTQHLDVLEAAGLISTKREGRYKFHYLDTKPLNAIIKRWLKPKRKAGEP